MKTLIMMSAIPASGKSTWSREYMANHENTYIVSSDQIRMEICGGSFQDHSKQDLVWKIFSEKMHEYGSIEGATVILDALNDTNAVRLKYLNDAKEFDKKILVIFPVNLEKSLKYNGMRDPKVAVPEDALRELYKKFEQPSEEVLNLVDEVVRVNWD